MSLLLYVDQHVKAAITAGLRRRGLDLLTAHEDGASAWDDELLLERATSLGRVLFTQDEDFLVIAKEWQGSGREFAGILYAHQLGLSIGQAVKEIELIAQVYDPADIRGRVEFLPLV